VPLTDIPLVTWEGFSPITIDGEASLILTMASGDAPVQVRVSEATAVDIGRTLLAYLGPQRVAAPLGERA
jgi:hypothetical protein